MPGKNTLTIILQLIVLNILLITAVHSQQKNSPEKRNEKPGEYTIEQAISDNAQLHTIAFNGLAFITGSYGADLFFPPGKVADCFGFQYMRDNDSNGLGHNTSFLGKIADNILYILNSEQNAELTELARKQEKLYIDFAETRFIIIKAFRQKLEGDKREFNRQAFLDLFMTLYEIDAKLSYQRAEVMGKIINSFTESQKDYLSGLGFLNSSSWPDIDRREIKRKKLPHMQNVAVMTYASEMFSWYKGNTRSDVYFCPERHGTYFGGFYLKDQPAMNNPGYSISTNLTGNSGKEFLLILNDKEKQMLTDAVTAQKSQLEKIVSLREEISKQLRKFISGDKPEESVFVDIVKNYGFIDGELSLNYAEIFTRINQSLNEKQKSQLRDLRALDIKPEGGYLYSEPVPLPEKIDCDFLFEQSKQ